MQWEPTLRSTVWLVSSWRTRHRCGSYCSVEGALKKTPREELSQLSQVSLTDIHSYQDDIYVMRGLRNTIRSPSYIAGLQLVQQICSIEAESDIKKQFPKVFNGTWNIGGRVHNQNERWRNSMLSTLLEIYCNKR